MSGVSGLPVAPLRSTPWQPAQRWRSEEHTSELQSRPQLVCRLLLEKKNGLTPHSSQIMRIQLPLVYLVCDTVFFLSLDAVSPYCRQPARARLTIRAFLFPAHVGGHP